MDTNRSAKIIETILLRLEEAMKGLDKKLDESIKALNTTIDAKIDLLREDITNDIISKIRKNEAIIEASSNRILELEARVQRLENSMELSSKANDLIVKGIPVMVGEKCTVVYQRIAEAIGYDTDKIPRAEAFRLGKKQPKSKWDPPILLKFTNRLDKDEFHGKYFKFKDLRLPHVGYRFDQRIFITENLTKFNQTIFSQATKMKTEQTLKSVSTYHGSVFVKQKEDDPPVRINTISELEQFGAN
jgi:hypothetical protein